MTTKLIIGLGNPGTEYEDTRHNMGFLFLDFLVKKMGNNDFALDKKTGSFISKGTLHLKNKKISTILVKPESYVNTSGSVVLKLKNTFKAKPKDIIIIQDDLDIPFGNSKLSFDRNSGGHRGIESIIKSLKTKSFYRLRIGTQTRAVEKAHQQSEKKRDELIKEYVLSKLSPSEHKTLEQVFLSGLDKLISLLTQ